MVTENIDIEKKETYNFIEQIVKKDLEELQKWLIYD